MALRNGRGELINALHAPIILSDESDKDDDDIASVNPVGKKRIVIDIGESEDDDIVIITRAERKRPVHHVDLTSEEESAPRHAEVEVASSHSEEQHAHSKRRSIAKGHEEADNAEDDDDDDDDNHERQQATTNFSQKKPAKSVAT